MSGNIYDGYPASETTWEKLSKIKLPTGPALPSISAEADCPEDLIIEEPDGSQIVVSVVQGAGGRPRLAVKRQRTMNSGSALNLIDNRVDNHDRD